MAAPKGNQFYKLAVKSLGCPPKYETLDDLQKEIIAYFEDQEHIKKPRYTVTGLMAFLGFSARKHLYAQADRGKDFCYLINTALTIIAACYENNLYSPTPAGAIFALKNLRPDEFKDKTEVEQKNINIDFHEEKTYETKS